MQSQGYLHVTNKAPEMHSLKAITGNAALFAYSELEYLGPGKDLVAAEEIMLPPKLVRDGSQQVLGSQHSSKAQSEDSGICFQGENDQKPRKMYQ